MTTVYGAAVKLFFPGMPRRCAQGHEYVVTEAMSRNGSYTCPKCASARSVEYARTHRESKRASNNAYQKRISDRRSHRTAAYRARHPERRAAHQAIQTALRNGSLIRETCLVCGSTKTHAHHDDYSKQLVVLWLCHQHHMARHQYLRAERDK